MKNGIVIKEIDKNTSFRDIKQVMEHAHKNATNEKLNFPTSNMTEEDLKKTVENGGKWFIATCDNRIVGTICGFKEKFKGWYYKGNIIVIKYVAIHPEYSGRHIVSNLYKKIFEYAASEKIKVCIMSMSEYNYHHQHVAEKNGFILVDFFAAEKLKNYTLSYAYWVESKCPHSKSKIKMMLFVRKIKARIKRLIRK